jgi:hypothetical protein
MRSLRGRAIYRPAVGLLAWLLGVLVLAQTLGQMHQIVHAPRAQSQQHSLFDRPAQDRASSGNWVERLFAGHEDGGTDCRLYDQAAHGDCASAPASLFGSMPPAEVSIGLFEARTPALRAALVRARGPPRNR